jgi:hypothetical protein
MTDRMTDRQTTEVSDHKKDQVGDDRWRQTACILYSINWDIEVRLGGRRFERIRGDKAHSSPQGYTPWHKHVPARIEAAAMVPA